MSADRCDQCGQLFLSRWDEHRPDCPTMARPVSADDAARIREARAKALEDAAEAMDARGTALLGGEAAWLRDRAARERRGGR